MGDRIQRMKDYSIETLVKTFHEHDVKAKKDNEKMNKRYLEEYGKPYPYYDDFSISAALKSICEEIVALKASIQPGIKNILKDDAIGIKQFFTT